MRKPRSTYQSCSELPLYNFIQILVNDKKELLYDRPNKAWYKQADLEVIWDNIFMEYIELSADERFKYIFDLNKDLQVLINKIDIIQKSIFVLSTADDLSKFEPTITGLRADGFLYSFTKETIENDLIRVVKSSRSLLIERDQLIASIKEVTDNDNEKATEKDFSKSLANLSKFMGFQIDAKKTSVLSYISYVEQFKASIDKDGKRAVNQ